jgi:hypothetical protein
VIGDNPKGLPSSIGGLFNTAFSLYGRRFAFYFALALAAALVQYVVDVAVPRWTGLRSPGLTIGLSVIVDAFIVAAVTIGVALDLVQKDADWSQVLGFASERWGVVAVIGFVAFLVDALLEPVVLGPQGPDTLYGIMIVPTIAIWGALTLAQVVGAIEPARSRLMLPLIALGKGMAVAFRFTNLSRLLVLSVILVIPIFVEQLLGDQLAARHLADAVFWSNVPIDALTVGPLQALATVFYIDFLRRAQR